MIVLEQALHVPRNYWLPVQSTVAGSNQVQPNKHFLRLHTTVKMATPTSNTDFIYYNHRYDDYVTFFCSCSSRLTKPYFSYGTKLLTENTLVERQDINTALLPFDFIMNQSNETRGRSNNEHIDLFPATRCLRNFFS